MLYLLVLFSRMLQDDPELFQLYKDLVVSQVISAEEFWASRAHVCISHADTGELLMCGRDGDPSASLPVC